MTLKENVMRITTVKRPPLIFDARAKQTLVRWLAVYPILTLALWELGSTKLPTWIFTLIVTLIVVPFVHYVMLPITSRITHAWVEMPAFTGAMRHRMAFALWCSTYPVITVLLYVFPLRLLGQLPLPALTFFITALAVPVINYLVLPHVLKAAGSWVHRKA
jgi:antibiotic biosynthesis monooxygenase (ABM) superfamily enzyme